MLEKTIGAIPASRPRGSAVHIAAGITEAYVLPLLVVLSSLTENLSGARPVLHLFHSGLSDGSLERIGRVVELRSVALSPEATSLRHAHFPPVAATPLLLADRLPADLDRVLFLDADLLVLDDVRILWEWDLEEAVVGACRDMAIPTCGAARGVKSLATWGVRPEAPYFNAGVLVVDLPAWRDARVAQRATEYLRRIGRRVDFFHQEALNAVLSEDWHPLPARWNLLGGVAGRSFERPPSEAWRNPGIVHFAGRMKPWRMPVGGRFDGRYRIVLERLGEPSPGARPGWRETLCAHYDRKLRRFLFPLERMLWRMRLL